VNLRRLGILGAFAAVLVLLLGLAAPAGAQPAQSAQSAASTPTAAPSSVAITRNIEYGADGSDKLTLDVFAPPNAKNRPVMILVHGGGWIEGDKQQYDPGAKNLAAAGYVVFDVDYSLDLTNSPAYPREVTDVQHALTWVRQHAVQYGGNADRLGLFGGSAGGYLVAMVATMEDTATAQPVRAVVSLSGPTDITALAGLLRDNENQVSPGCTSSICKLYNQTTDQLQRLLGCAPLSCPAAKVAAASPITHVTKYSPPFLIANSTNELVPVAQATSMASALQQAGVAVNLQLVSGTGHATEYLSQIAQPVADFLQEYVAGPTIPPVVVPPAQHSGHHGVRVWLIVLLVIVVLAALLGGTALTRRPRKTSPQAPDHSIF
jgi:acetyl esterase